MPGYTLIRLVVLVYLSLGLEKGPFCPSNDNIGNKNHDKNYCVILETEDEIDVSRTTS